MITAKEEQFGGEGGRVFLPRFPFTGLKSVAIWSPHLANQRSVCTYTVTLSFPPFLSPAGAAPRINGPGVKVFVSGSPLIPPATSPGTRSLMFLEEGAKLTCRARPSKKKGRYRHSPSAPAPIRVEAVRHFSRGHPRLAGLVSPPLPCTFSPLSYPGPGARRSLYFDRPRWEPCPWASRLL